MLLAEINGRDLMAFSDYLQNSRWVAKKAIPGFEKLGADLLKLGFNLYHDGNVRFVKDEDSTTPGLGWAILFPHARTYNNGVETMYSGWDPEVEKMIVGRDYFSLKEIETFGLEACLRKTKAKASSI